MAFVVIGISNTEASQDVLWGPFPSPWEASEHIEHLNEIGVGSDFADLVAVALNAPEAIETPVYAGLDLAMC